MIEVSIIIVNFNTFALACKCIESIYAKTRNVNFEIILVDNGSWECHPGAFVKLFPDVALIANKTNEGFGRANNRAMKVAKGKYFLLLNSDTRLLNNAVDLAFEYAEANKDKYAVFGADIRNEDLSSQRSFYRKKPISLKNALIQGIFLENVLFYKLYSLVNQRPLQDAQNIGGLYGSYVFLNRIVYEAVGGFDPDFFMYCEDTEWFRNRISKKYRVGICPHAMVMHLGGKSSDSIACHKESVLSFYLYWYKAGYLQYIIYVLFSYLNTLPNLLLLPFMRAPERAKQWVTIICKYKCVRKVLFDIPSFSNRYESRTRPLSFAKIDNA